MAFLLGGGDFTGAPRVIVRRRARAGIPRTARKGGRSGGSFQPRKVQQDLPASTRIAAK